MTVALRAGLLASVLSPRSLRGTDRNSRRDNCSLLKTVHRVLVWTVNWFVGNVSWLGHYAAWSRGFLAPTYACACIQHSTGVPSTICLPWPGIVLFEKHSLVWESRWHVYAASHFRSSVEHKLALRFQSLSQTWATVLVASKLFKRCCFYSPVWNKNGFIVLEICLQDWKDFPCACCLWSYSSQCDYNIALVPSWSLLFGAAKHNSIRVALFWAGSKSWALLSALKLSNVWKAGGWWDLVGAFERCGVWKAVFT